MDTDRLSGKRMIERRHTERENDREKAQRQTYRQTEESYRDTGIGRTYEAIKEYIIGTPGKRKSTCQGN